MNSDRIKKIQDGTLAPNSTSVMKALYQVWDECEQEAQAIITELEAKIQRVAVAANEMYHDNRKGDFELSTLALLDLHGILAALKEDKS